MPIKNVSIRIDQDLLTKLHYAAAYEGRSVNSQILVLIRQYLRQFESAHGVICLGRPNGPAQ